jgi:glycosyltransferase involved in cell wall biosynthesis
MVVLYICTSEKATSLINVARDIYRVALKLNIPSRVRSGMIQFYELDRERDQALYVMCADPLLTTGWFLAVRDCHKFGRKAVMYATVEGRLKRMYVKDWMREVNIVAVSNYVREKLVEAGLNVIGVVHHGIDIEEVVKARGMMRLGLEYYSKYGLSPDRHVIMLTVSNPQPRKGLAWLDKIAEEVEKRDSSIKFLVITEEKGLRYFGNHRNLIVSTDFGRLPREMILSIIANAHVMVVPSLAEGFHLPTLEAMALGTPVVHGQLPPLLEFSTGWVVPATEILFFDQHLGLPSGIEFEQHLYDVKEFADVLMHVVDLYRCKREEIVDYRRRSWERALEYSIYNKYPKLIRYLVDAPESIPINVEPYDFNSLPQVPPQITPPSNIERKEFEDLGVVIPHG